MSRGCVDANKSAAALDGRGQLAQGERLRERIHRAASRNFDAPELFLVCLSRRTGEHRAQIGPGTNPFGQTGPGGGRPVLERPPAVWMKQDVGLFAQVPPGKREVSGVAIEN